MSSPEFSKFDEYKVSAPLAETSVYHKPHSSLAGCSAFEEDCQPDPPEVVAFLNQFNLTPQTVSARDRVLAIGSNALPYAFALSNQTGAALCASSLAALPKLPDGTFNVVLYSVEGDFATYKNQLEDRARKLTIPNGKMVEIVNNPEKADE